jgi:ACS family tartrate transporter-like MFS transporter
MDVSPPAAEPAVDPDALRRKLMARIVPLVFALYIVAYLDRVNVSFVKEPMMQALAFPDAEAVYGVGAGLFFAGYLLLEIPGALLVEHWSARKWFARILVTWGLCSMGLALVRTEGQFYLARFLLGLAEAGFFPGILVYFTHWFPRADRARALAGLVLGVPFSQALGAWVSGQILQLDWFGLAGWQWVFLVEGLPAVLLGVAVPFLMVDRPRQARWLTAAEREWLERTLEAERRSVAAAGVTLGQALRLPAVWLLGLGILAANTGGYALSFWLPSTVQALWQATGAEGADAAGALNWVGLYYLCGLAGVWLAGQSSDRLKERKWHCVGGMVLTGVCLAAAVVPGLPWPVVLGGLCLTGFFAYAWPPPFWVLPTQVLSASAAAVALGFLNVCANLAGLIGLPATGWLKEAHWDVRACVWAAAACYGLGGAVVALVRAPAVTAPPRAGPGGP